MPPVEAELSLFDLDIPTFKQNIGEYFRAWTFKLGHTCIELACSIGEARVGMLAA